MPPGALRPRVGPRATRLVQEISAAENRAGAERILAGHDLTHFGDDERERLNELLADALSKLPD
jgi:hypothetical protein